MATLKAPSKLTESAVHLPRWVDVVYLDDANAKSYTVPSTAKYALLSSDGNFWVRVGDTAAVPTTDVTDGTGSFRIGSTAQARVEAGSTVSMIREDASTTIVSIGVFD